MKVKFLVLKHKKTDAGIGLTIDPKQILAAIRILRKMQKEKKHDEHV